MEPSWSKRFWELFVDADNAFIPLDKTKKIDWTKIASQRYWSTIGKWYGY